MNKHWIVIAPLDHVQAGMREEYCQVDQGIKNPFEKIRRGDWVVYYSPSYLAATKATLHSFTAIGCVLDEYTCTPTDQNPLAPFRRSMVYLRGLTFLPILDVHASLDFVEDANDCDYKLHSGFFDITPHDFEMIRLGMDLVSLTDKSAYSLKANPEGETVCSAYFSTGCINEDEA